MKPRVFVGSSVEALQIAYAIQKNLRHQAEVTVWDQGIFALSRSSLQSLVSALSTFDFGVFVFAPDDLVTIRGEEHRLVRDNVLFELGLFIGELGQNRCFILVPEGAGELRFPTDLLGVEPATYETSRSDDNWQAATGPACTDIRREFELEGRRTTAEDRTEGTSPATESADSVSRKPEPKPPEEDEPIKQELTYDPWLISMIEGRPADALAQVEEAISKETSPEKLFDLKLWRGFILFEHSVDQGEQAFREAARNHPDRNEPWLRLSSALLRGGFRERALEIAEEGLVALPGNAQLLVAKAHCLESLQRADEAESVLAEQLDGEGPNRSDFFVQLARLHSQHGKIGEALEVIARGLASFPFHVGLLELEANLFVSSNDHARAVTVYRQLITLRPAEPSYHALMANSLLELNLYGIALDSYRRADSLANSSQPWITANIGNILSARGFFGFGLEYLDKALASEPTSDYTQDRALTAKRNRAAEWQRLENLFNEAIGPPKKTEPDGTRAGGA